MGQSLMDRKKFFELISSAIARSGKAPEEIAKGKGFSAEYLRKTAKGQRIPEDDIILKMADALGIDKATLLRAAHIARSSPEVRRYLEVLPLDRKTLPSYGQIIAGDPTLSIQESEGEYQVLPEQWGKNRYILTVSGESMYPELKEGDRVLIENLPEGIDPKRCHMKICAVLLNGESTLKRIFIDRKGGKLSIQLKPDNPLLPAYTVKEDDEFQIQGIVIEIIRRKLS